MDDYISRRKLIVTALGAAGLSGCIEEESQTGTEEIDSMLSPDEDTRNHLVVSEENPKTVKLGEKEYHVELQDVDVPSSHYNFAKVSIRSGEDHHENRLSTNDSPQSFDDEFKYSLDKVIEPDNPTEYDGNAVVRLEFHGNDSSYNQ